ncbi:MAG: zf-HC2 domain-containing protein [Phycisphaerales bacterium]|nr:zf-HC2 domain-containing protein [Phycisphaerales bacterium]
MKTCEEMREVLGPYVDGEGSPETRATIEAHVCTCKDCHCEVTRIRELGARIEAGGSVCVPSALWERIESRLAEAPKLVRVSHWLRLRSVVAAAACLLLAVGGGYFMLTQGLSTRAEAATVNFSALLDGLSVDAEKAFREFVQLYRGRRVTAAEARRHASQLNFEIPATLPGGFQLDEAFALKIGDAPAAAATYRRSGEFVGTIFHRAIHPEDYGTHRDHPCVIGEHRGHRVEVGEWRLVHVTDATTCHCVLSRLGETEELPEILRAVAPDAKSVDHSHP